MAGGRDTGKCLWRRSFRAFARGRGFGWEKAPRPDRCLAPGVWQLHRLVRVGRPGPAPHHMRAVKKEEKLNFDLSILGTIRNLGYFIQYT